MPQHRYLHRTTAQFKYIHYYIITKTVSHHSSKHLSLFFHHINRYFTKMTIIKLTQIISQNFPRAKSGSFNYFLLKELQVRVKMRNFAVDFAISGGTIVARAYCE